MKIFFHKYVLVLVTLLQTTTVLSQQTFKEEKLSSKRSQIILNGAWGFQPIAGNANESAGDDWGIIRVPGAWATDGFWWSKLPGVIKKGEGLIWKESLSKVAKAWYKQTVTIPKSWKGSVVELELERVATDAVIFINNQKAGSIEWYAGKADITKWVQFGKENEIRLLVIATPDEGEVANLMGTAEAQVTFSKATLPTKGITGNVILSCRPSGPHIADIFVKTSVRKHTLEAEIELFNVMRPMQLTLESSVYDAQGNIVKKFTQQVSTGVKEQQIITVGNPWYNPKLWDLDQPNLYRLKTTVLAGGKVLDEYSQLFGFREFWIDGKNFFLNGTRINLRPFVDVPGNGMSELIAAGIDGLRKNGFNFSELWPANFDVRGDVRNWREIMEVADTKGYLLSGVTLPFIFYMVDKKYSFRWNKEGVKEKWEQRMLYELKKQRNHPSVVMWGTSANFFGNAQDQNPLNIGQTNWIKGNDFWERNLPAANDAIATIKKYDLTRPVFTHHGTYVGDVHTLNFYLNLIPLQEREEWISHYASFGKIPFMGIEFGTPLHCTFLRGRNSFGNNIKTEPLVTEYTAMYDGSRAYHTETIEYRSLIKNNFIGGQKYKEWVHATEMERMPSFQAVQNLFSKNTWRSYRTWGVPGGMVPWTKGHGWIESSKASQKVPMPSFLAGRKGNYFEEATISDTKFLQADGWETLSGGKAIVENNNDVLAYIAGGEEAFTAKDHHYRLGDWMQKQFFFFNDTRQPQSCKWEAKVLLEAKEFYIEKGALEIPVGEKRHYTFQCRMPIQQSVAKADAQVILRAIIGEKVIKDTFAFRIFNYAPNKKKSVYVFDPEGKTSHMLTTAGYAVINWDGKMTIPFLVIGRNAMLPAYAAPFDLEAFIRNGGKALVMNQHPDSVAAKKGLRTSPYISRYVFPVDASLALFQGLDEPDFRNWTGCSKLTEAYPDYMDQPVKKGAYEIPYYGWHWGNRGGVATGAIEKPHRSAWRPLMECEFDLAWSPLMELSYGKGHLLLTTLDLEDHYDEDVVAAIMAERLVNYIDTIKLVSRSEKTILLGSDSDARLLDAVGVNYQRSNGIDKDVELLIVGSINPEQEAAIEKFVGIGGNVLVLPRKKVVELLGVKFALDTAFNGGYHIPDWREAAGLSVSDTRYRTQFPTIVIQSGCDEINVDGLLGRKKVGNGSVIFSQFDPDRFSADSLTYFRFTRWRQTRALSQVLANMGASFKMDKAFFEQQNSRQQKNGFYHPDYKDDFEMGDDPFRYFRW